MPPTAVRAVLTAVLLLAAAPVGASAEPVSSAVVVPLHARLLSASPADGSTVERATEVVLRFNENPNPDFVQVAATGPGGASIADGAPEVEGPEVRQALAADLPAGRHTLVYRVVSVDGHPISGTVSFTTTGAASASPTPSPGATPSPGETPTSATSSAEPTATPSPTPGVETVDDDSRTMWPWFALGGGLAAAAVVAGLRRRRPERPVDPADRDPEA